MKNHTPHVVDDILTWTKTAVFDLPLMSAQQALGVEVSVDTKETATVTAWQGYDASVRVLTAVVDALYRTPLTSTVVDNAMAAFLRWQQVGNAMTGAMFSGLWYTLGVPKTTDLQALNEALTQLATEVRKQRDAQATLLHLVAQLPRPPRTPEQTDTTESSFRRYVAPQHRASLAMLRRTHQKGN